MEGGAVDGQLDADIIKQGHGDGEGMPGSGATIRLLSNIRNISAVQRNILRVQHQYVMPSQCRDPQI